MPDNEPFVPWMRSLLERMKELYNKPDAQTIAEALPEVGGGGGDVTPAAIVSATGQMTDQQAMATRDNIDSEPKKLTITVTENGGVYSSDKTWTEISTAYNNGKVPVARFGDDYYGLANTDSVDFFFSVCSGGKIKQISLTPAGNVEIWSYAEIAVQPAMVTVSGTTPTITPAANTVYNCGELGSLTVSSSPASGAYSIVFTSGATATVTTFPATILGLENFAAEENTLYEINVLDNRAVVGSWAVSA